VAFCPVCKAEWPAETTECPICGKELPQTADNDEWTMIGEIEDKLSADFARETLSTYEIPAVIVSRSGFFGQIGLNLTAFYSGKQALFEVRVPNGFETEAAELLEMTLGEKWRRKG
jgi:hypothetical protein